MMSNKNKSRMRQYGSLLLCSILCVMFLMIPARAADLDEDIDAAETTKTNIPIVAMTANAFKEDEEMALSVGMNGHIAKPIDVDKVEQVLCSILR